MIEPRTTELRDNERIDDLLTHELRIIQSSDVFSFSLDAVLLARFCSVPAKGHIVDLCSGNGVIPLLLSTRTKAAITGVEIQELLWDMAVRNVRMNGLDDQIDIRLGDLRDISAPFRPGGAQLVTVNPPYIPVNGSSHINENKHVAIARHEVACTLDDVIAASSRLLMTGGKLALVHRPTRLGEIFAVLRRFRLEPKRIRYVHPRIDAEANMVLIEALRDGKPELRTMPPLIVYDDNGQYCRELLQVYYGEVSVLKG